MLKDTNRSETVHTTVSEMGPMTENADNSHFIKLYAMKHSLIL